jgi:hypothetical protein
MDAKTSIHQIIMEVMRKYFTRQTGTLSEINGRCVEPFSPRNNEFLVRIDKAGIATNLTPLYPTVRISELAEVAQLVEHLTENQGVASSILALGTGRKHTTP